MTNQEIYEKINQSPIFGSGPISVLSWKCPCCLAIGDSNFFKIDLSINYNTFEQFFLDTRICRGCGHCDCATRFWSLDADSKTMLLIEIQKWFRNIEPELTMPVDVDKKLDSKRDEIFREIF